MFKMRQRQAPTNWSLSRRRAGPARAMAKACEGLKAQFLDARRGWAEAFRHVVRAYVSGRRPSGISWLPPQN